MSVAAVIAARGGSVRLPRKALLPFAGRPLIAHKIVQLRRCPLVSRVYVNTDDAEIRAVALDFDADVMDGRDYAGDTREMLRHSATQVSEDVLLWAHPTNPLVSPETYADALIAYEAATRVGYDSLVSVQEIRRHAWYGGRPLNYDPWQAHHPLAADCGPVYFQDGAIFIQRTNAMIGNRYFFAANPTLFVTPANECGDIDTRADYDDVIRR